MDLEYFTTCLSNNAEAIRHLVAGVPPEQGRWKPEPEAWSILEVINHLYDEEREDFRTRLDLFLYHPGRPWPDINPPAWVIERQYNQRDLETSLANFLTERQTSITWLEKLVSPNWAQTLDHPARGRMSAADLLAAWLAHDFLHLRQLTELQWRALSQFGTPYVVDYAGAWE